MKYFRNCLIIFSTLLLSSTCCAQVKSSNTKVLKNDSTPIINSIALNSFFGKLTKKDKELIRIIHWGDSHIQMGYMSEELRTGIDSLFELNGFGGTFPYKAANYNPNHSITKIKKGKWIGGNIMYDTLSKSSGFMGFWTNTLDTNAIIQFGISQSAKFQEGNTHVTIFYSTDLNTNIEFKGVNLRRDSTLFFQPVYIDRQNPSGQKWTVAQLIFDQNIDAIEINITNNTGSNGVNIHGAIFEHSWNKGITYNSCGVGGAQFKHLFQNSTTPIEQLKFLKPDLIIISFGSNESYTIQFDIEVYKNSITRLVDDINKELPNTSLLFTAPPDTKSKNRHPRNTSTICSILKELSMEKGFAYWDLRAAMGGEGSILKWLSNGWASTDKLHFTKQGYSLQGKWMMNAINQAYLNFLQNTKYEK